MTLAAAGAPTAQAAFWSLPSASLAGAAAAAGIALVNSVGNVAGFASTYVVGFMTDLTHSTTPSLLPFAAFLVVAGLLILTIPLRLVDR